MRPTLNSRGSYVNRSVCGKGEHLQRVETQRQHAQISDASPSHKNDAVKRLGSNFKICKLQKVETSVKRQRDMLKEIEKEAQR